MGDAKTPTSPRQPRPIGRRPGSTDTRGHIATIARRHFAERGYDKATLRAIAADADVDPALITHYFGTKRQLFAEVVEPPVDPDRIMTALAEVPPDELGERLAELVVGLLDDPTYGATFTALLRTAANNPDIAVLLGDRINHSILLPLAEQLDTDRPRLRATLAATQTLGLVVAHQIIQLDTITQIDRAELIAVVAPTLQRYLTGPL